MLSIFEYSENKRTNCMHILSIRLRTKACYVRVFCIYVFVLKFLDHFLMCGTTIVTNTYEKTSCMATFEFSSPRIAPVLECIDVSFRQNHPKTFSFIRMNKGVFAKILSRNLAQDTFIHCFTYKLSINDWIKYTHEEVHSTHSTPKWMVCTAKYTPLYYVRRNSACKIF